MSEAGRFRAPSGASSTLGNHHPALIITGFAMFLVGLIVGVAFAGPRHLACVSQPDRLMRAHPARGPTSSVSVSCRRYD